RRLDVGLEVAIPELDRVLERGHGVLDAEVRSVPCAAPVGERNRSRMVEERVTAHVLHPSSPTARHPSPPSARRGGEGNRSTGGEDSVNKGLTNGTGKPKVDRMTPAPSIQELIETVQRDAGSDDVLDQLATASATVNELNETSD